MGKTNHQFRVELPDGWQDQTIHHFIGPFDRGTQHMLTVTMDNEPSTTDAADYAEIRKDALLDARPDLEMLFSGDTELPSGREVYELVYKTVPPGGAPTLTRMIFYIEGKQAFTFSATLNKHTLRTIGTEVTAIVDSLLIDLVTQG